MSAEQVVKGGVPNPFRSLEEYERYWHEDLARLEYFELWLEWRRVDVSVPFAPPRKLEWLVGRRAAVLDEMRRRRSRSGVAL